MTVKQNSSSLPYFAQARFSPVSPATDGRIANCLLTAGIPACGPAYKKALGALSWGTPHAGLRPAKLLLSA